MEKGNKKDSLTRVTDENISYHGDENPKFGTTHMTSNLFFHQNQFEALQNKRHRRINAQSKYATNTQNFEDARDLPHLNIEQNENPAEHE